jgi:chromosome segregation ATPase|tara:strand:+ start:4028 stop:4612 length:585 start_codon:yes stop_codon:yes gene_type:complete
MAEIEYGGIKLGGSKLLLIIPLITTLGGGLWGGFEFYKDYTDMKETITSYKAPDLEGIRTNIAVMNEHQKTVESHMEFVEKELKLFKQEFANVRTGLQDTTDYLRDTKHDLKDELVRAEKIMDKIDNDITIVEDKAEALMDRIKKETRTMIDDANNRFNDKIDGMEGYVKRELTQLEKELNSKLTRALDNPLAN